VVSSLSSSRLRIYWDDGPWRPHAQPVVTAARGMLQDKAAEAARQGRILAALDLTPMQVCACHQAGGCILVLADDHLGEGGTMNRTESLRV